MMRLSLRFYAASAAVEYVILPWKATLLMPRENSMFVVTILTVVDTKLKRAVLKSKVMKVHLSNAINVA
jgi:hypothetical protein